MIAKGGQALLKPDAIDTIKARSSLALLVTPNVHEAQQLSGIEITSLADARRAARSFINSVAPMCSSKGPSAKDRGTDLLYDGRFFQHLQGEFIDTPIRTAPDAFASAIAAHTSPGKTVPDAIQTIKPISPEAISAWLGDRTHGKGPPIISIFLNQG